MFFGGYIIVPNFNISMSQPPYNGTTKHRLSLTNFVSQYNHILIRRQTGGQLLSDFAMLCRLVESPRISIPETRTTNTAQYAYNGKHLGTATLTLTIQLALWSLFIHPLLLWGLSVSFFSFNKHASCLCSISCRIQH